MDYASLTERIKGSNPRSAGHFGGGRQHPAIRIVTTPDSKLQGQGCQSLPPLVVSPIGYGTCLFKYTPTSTAKKRHTATHCDASFNCYPPEITNINGGFSSVGMSNTFPNHPNLCQ